MSLLHYFASDTVLEERKNPYIEKQFCTELQWIK